MISICIELVEIYLPRFAHSLWVPVAPGQCAGRAHNTQGLPGGRGHTQKNKPGGDRTKPRRNTGPGCIGRIGRVYHHSLITLIIPAGNGRVRYFFIIVLFFSCLPSIDSHELLGGTVYMAHTIPSGKVIPNYNAMPCCDAVPTSSLHLLCHGVCIFLSFQKT